MIEDSRFTEQRPEKVGLVDPAVLWGLVLIGSVIGTLELLRYLGVWGFR